MTLLLIPSAPGYMPGRADVSFYSIRVVPHVATDSPNTILCLFVSAKLFPNLKIQQIFIAEISSP